MRGTGPFSETLEVRPEPSLAHLGKVSGNNLRLDHFKKCKPKDIKHNSL